MMIQADDLVIINVGGTLFETRYETLRVYPETRLGKLTTESKEYVASKKCYFYDRDPDVFNSFLNFYRLGELHMPMGCCGSVFRKELEFWEIDEGLLSDCCMQAYFKYENDIEVQQKLKLAFETPAVDYTGEELSRSMFNRLKSPIWLFLDQPKSSLPAQVFNIFYLLVVMLSMLILALSTMKECRIFYNPYYVFDNATVAAMLSIINVNNPKERLQLLSVLHPAIIYANRVCQCFFTLELILHFLSSPRKLTFFKAPMNALDLVLLITMCVAFGIEQEIMLIFEYPRLLHVYLATRVILIFRLFRIMRLVRQYDSLKVMFIALKNSIKEMMLLTVVFFVGAYFFGCFIFYSEYNEPTTYPNMFYGVWWAIVTMTTVGYGDYVPKSTAGHIVGSVCVVCGILLVAMPIAIVASKFSDFQDRNQERERRYKTKARKKKASLVRVSPVDDCQLVTTHPEKQK